MLQTIVWLIRSKIWHTFQIKNWFIIINPSNLFIPEHCLPGCWSWIWISAPPLQVRFSSLLMLMELASRLKENYVVLLPETIPFLAELMEGEDSHNWLGSQLVSAKNQGRFSGSFLCVCVCVFLLILWLMACACVCFADECEEVEQQVQKVIQEMENILGEPLQSYF